MKSNGNEINLQPKRVSSVFAPVGPQGETQARPTRRHSKLTPRPFTVLFSAEQYRRSVNAVSSLAECRSSPARPEQNMLPRTFLTGLERIEGVRGGEGERGRTADRCTAGKGEGKSEQRRGGTERGRFSCFQCCFCCGGVLNLDFEFGLKGEHRIVYCHIDMLFLYPV